MGHIPHPLLAVFQGYCRVKIQTLSLLALLLMISVMNLFRLRTIYLKIITPKNTINKLIDNEKITETFISFLLHSNNVMLSHKHTFDHHCARSIKFQFISHVGTKTPRLMRHAPLNQLTSPHIQKTHNSETTTYTYNHRHSILINF